MFYNLDTTYPPPGEEGAGIYKEIAKSQKPVKPVTLFIFQ
jgi:hypothetical protein